MSTEIKIWVLIGCGVALLVALVSLMPRRPQCWQTPATIGAYREVVAGRNGPLLCTHGAETIRCLPMEACTP